MTMLISKKERTSSFSIKKKENLKNLSKPLNKKLKLPKREASNNQKPEPNKVFNNSQDLMLKSENFKISKNKLEKSTLSKGLKFKSKLMRN